MKSDWSFAPAGGWDLKVSSRKKAMEVTVNLTPPRAVSVRDELQKDVPLYTERRWLAGRRLNGVLAHECSVTNSFLPDSLKIRRCSDGKRLIHGTDFIVDPVWGAFGRVADSSFGEKDPVYVSYRYLPLRIDAVVLKNGRIFQKKGKVNGACPLPPEPEKGEELLCRIFFDRPRSFLTADQIYPVLEPYRGTCAHGKVSAMLPGLWKKLNAGKKVRILAWGDSVTNCSFIEDPERRWPAMIRNGLQAQFPKAEIELVNLGWGGRNTTAFMNEPAGSPWNYGEKVVDSDADLVLFEFINDGGLPEKIRDENYARILKDLRKHHRDMIVIIPHFTRPDWLGIPSQNHVKEDPREYVKFLRKWAEKNGFPYADISERFLHLWKEGIPYNTLMLNNINHPDQRGCDLYAETVLELFRQDRDGTAKNHESSFCVSQKSEN